MLLPPLNKAIHRRLIAGAMALVINAALISFILLAPRDTPRPDEPDVIDIVFVSLPLIEPEPEPEPIVEEEEEEPVEEVVEEPDVALEEPSNPTSTPDENEEEEEEEPAVNSLALWQNHAPLPLPESQRNETAETLRSLFCMTTSEANREAGECPFSDEGEGLALLQSAQGRDVTDQAAPFGFDLTPQQIRALFGIREPRLAGQPTVDNSRRPTSSADEMRDTLPPQHPDPGFGD